MWSGVGIQGNDVSKVSKKMEGKKKGANLAPS
jgi:hypothetical protein